MLQTVWLSGLAAAVRLGLLALAALLLACSGDAQPSPPAPTPWDSPLPRSMKGYELYSWYAADEEQWRHVLMTGTNRLKGYDEIVSPANEVTSEGWVALSVAGTGDLRALLGQLPRGEEVFWIDKPWLQGAGADPALMETIRLPDQTIVAELQQFCQEAGLNLHVD